MVTQTSFLSQIACSTTINSDDLLKLLRDQLPIRCKSSPPLALENEMDVWRDTDLTVISFYIDCLRSRPTHFTWPLFFSDIVRPILSIDDHFLGDSKINDISTTVIQCVAEFMTTRDDVRCELVKMLRTVVRELMDEYDDVRYKPTDFLESIGVNLPPHDNESGKEKNESRCDVKLMQLCHLFSEYFAKSIVPADDHDLESLKEVFAMLVAALPCQPIAIQTQLINWLLPNWFLFCITIPNTDVFESSAIILRRRLEKLPLTETLAILARMFDILFGNLFDVYITDRDLIQFIQDGLLDTNSVSRKRALYILKRLVDLTSSSSFPNTMFSELLSWSDQSRPDTTKDWMDFILLFETMEDGAHHLVEPMFPILKRLLNKSTLHPSWLVVILKTGLENNNTRIRKQTLDLILGQKDVEYLSRVARVDCLLFDCILPAVDGTNNFFGHAIGTASSPVGEAFSAFVCGLLETFEDEKDVVQIDFGEKHNSKCMAAGSIQALIESLSNVSINFDMLEARTYFKSLLLSLVVTMIEPTQISFPDLLCLLNECFPFPVSEKCQQIVKEVVSTSELSVDATARFVSDFIHKSSNNITPRSVALSVLFVDDGKVDTALTPLLEKLGRIYSHAYLDMDVKIRCLELLNEIFEVSEIFSSMKLVVNHCRQHLDECLAFCLAILLAPVTKQTDMDQNKTLLSLTLRLILLEPEKKVEDFTATQLLKAESLLANNNSSKPTLMESLSTIKWMEIIAISYSIFSKISVPLVPNEQQFKQVTTARLHTPYDLETLHTSWGLYQNFFMKAKWEALKEEFFDYCIDELDCINEGGMDQLLNVIEMLFARKIVCDHTKITTSLEKIVNAAESFAAAPYVHRRICDRVVATICQPPLLKPSFSETMSEIIDNMLSRADTMTMNLPQNIMKHLHAFWSTFSQDAVESMTMFTKTLVQFLMFGPVRSKWDRLQDVMVEKTPTSNDEARFSESFQFPRLLAFDLITRFDMSRQDVQKSTRKLLDELLDEASATVYKNSEGNHKSSMTFRCKFRLWQSILILVSYLKVSIFEQSYINDVFTRIMDQLLSGTPPGIRFLVEWSAMIILSENETCREVFWTYTADSNIRPAVATSLFTICLKTIDALQSYDNVWNQRVLEYATCYMMNNHHTVRMLACLAFEKSYDQITNHDAHDDSIKPKVVQQLKVFFDHNNEIQKFRAKALEFYIWNGFHAVRDFDLEFIFTSLIIVQQMNEEDCIPTDSFVRINSAPSNISLKVNFERPTVVEFQSTNASGDESSVLPHSEPFDSFQKKIVPWQSMLTTDIDLSRTTTTTKPRSDLIVVASLVDKPSNLGGLCRTCEIFNAGLLTVDSLKITSDSVFKSLAVTSDKWMPMVEVKKENIGSFLTGKKKEGYVIIGLEQATNSRKLPGFEFPKKCVLLLGEEKRGIPAELIQLLDVCVEIPQIGVTRSLNVHVSGALCIYEYMKCCSMNE